MIIPVAGVHIQLLLDRALFVLEWQTLCVADIHFGKDAYFQYHGVPIPSTLDHDLDRLSQLIEKTSAKRVVLLGDFIHHAEGMALPVRQAIAEWFARFPGVEFVLIKGNHEATMAQLPPEWRVRVCDRLQEKHLTFTHEPEGTAGQINLHGHLHPVVLLRSRRGRDRVRLPCFVMDPHQITLPSFGALTGGHPVEKRPARRIFALTDTELVTVEQGY